MLHIPARFPKTLSYESSDTMREGSEVVKNEGVKKLMLLAFGVAFVHCSAVLTEVAAQPTIGPIGHIVWVEGTHDEVELPIPRPPNPTILRDGSRAHYFCGTGPVFAGASDRSYHRNAYAATDRMGLRWYWEVVPDVHCTNCDCVDAMRLVNPGTARVGQLDLDWVVMERRASCNDDQSTLESCDPKYLGGTLDLHASRMSIEVLPNPGTCQETAAGAALHASEGATEPNKECVITADQGLLEKIWNCLVKRKEGKWCTSAPANVNARRILCDTGGADKCQCEYWFPDESWATPPARWRASAGASPSDYRSCGEGPGSSELLSFPRSRLRVRTGVGTMVHPANPYDVRFARTPRTRTDRQLHADTLGVRVHMDGTAGPCWLYSRFTRLGVTPAWRRHRRSLR